MYPCSLLFLQCLHYLDDVHGYGTLGQASSAAYTAELAVVVCREIHQLVHESLTETLQLCESGVAVSHFCEVGIHTGVPAAETLDAVSCIEVPDVVALTGGAYKGTGTAAETAFRKLSPLVGVEVLVQLVAAEIPGSELCKRKS